MSNTLRIVLVLAVASAIGACAKKVKEEPVLVEQPVTQEPVYTGKYK